LTARTFKQVPCSSTADFPLPQQLRCDKLHRQPTSLVGKKVFGLGQQSALQLLGSALAHPLDGQSTHMLLIARSTIPRVDSGEASLRSNSAQGNEDFSFKPILGWSMYAFAKLANAEMVAVRHDANALHRSAQTQGQNRMARFVVCRSLVGCRFHAFILRDVAFEAIGSVANSQRGSSLRRYFLGGVPIRLSSFPTYILLSAGLSRYRADGNSFRDQDHQSGDHFGKANIRSTVPVHR
jgi:hypothetical protein